MMIFDLRLTRQKRKRVGVRRALLRRGDSRSKGLKKHGKCEVVCDYECS